MSAEFFFNFNTVELMSYEVDDLLRKVARQEESYKKAVERPNGLGIKGQICC